MPTSDKFKITVGGTVVEVPAGWGAQIAATVGGFRIDIENYEERTNEGENKDTHPIERRRQASSIFYGETDGKEHARLDIDTGWQPYSPKQTQMPAWAVQPGAQA